MSCASNTCRVSSIICHGLMHAYITKPVLEDILICTSYKHGVNNKTIVNQVMINQSMVLFASFKEANWLPLDHGSLTILHCICTSICMCFVLDARIMVKRICVHLASTLGPPGIVRWSRLDRRVLIYYSWPCCSIPYREWRQGSAPRRAKQRYCSRAIKMTVEPVNFQARNTSISIAEDKRLAICGSRREGTAVDWYHLMLRICTVIFGSIHWVSF